MNCEVVYRRRTRGEPTPRCRFATALRLFWEFPRQEFQGPVERLAIFPEVGPEIADFCDALVEIAQGELLGGDVGSEFFGRERRRNGCFRECAHGIGAGERLAACVLQRVNEDAAFWTFADGTLECREL